MRFISLFLSLVTIPPFFSQFSFCFYFFAPSVCLIRTHCLFLSVYRLTEHDYFLASCPPYTVSDFSALRQTRSDQKSSISDPPLNPVRKTFKRSRSSLNQLRGIVLFFFIVMDLRKDESGWTEMCTCTCFAPVCVWRGEIAIENCCF